MAAGDLALMMLLSAQDLASVVVTDMATNFDSSLVSMGDSTLMLNDYLASLDDQVLTSAVSIDGLSASTDAADSSLATLGGSTDASAASLDTLASSADAADVALSTSGASVDALAASSDVASVSVDALAVSTDAAAASSDALAVSATVADAAVASEAVAADAAAGGMAGLTAAQDAVSASSSQLKKVGAGLLLVGAAAVGVGALSVKMAGDFQASMTQLVTGANESQANLGLVSQGILKMSVDTSTSTTDLSNAMFTVESAGFHGAAGIQVLQIAAEGAKVGNANLGQVTDVLTTTLHDYGLSAGSAVTVTNSLIQTVANGKMHMDDLNASLTNVLPVSSSLGVHLADVEGALATMAAAGDKGAAAGTHLAMMLKVLANPASSATKEMKAMGINSISLAKEMRTSLPGALQMIQNAVGQHFVPGSVEYNRAIAAILGGSKSGIAGLEIMGGNFKTLQANTLSAAGALHSGSKNVTNWNTVQQDFNFKMGQAVQAGKAFLITLGTELMPIFSKLVTQILPIIQNLIAWESKTHTIQNAIAGLVTGIVNFLIVGANIANFFAHNQAALAALGVVLGIVAVVIGTLLVMAFVAWAVAAWSAAVATIAATWPVLLIVLAVVALVAIIILLVQHWGAVTAFLKTIWQAFTSWLMGVLHAIGQFFVNVWNGIISFLKAAWAWIVTAAKIAFAVLLLIIGGPMLWIALLIYTHWNQIKSFLASAWAWVLSTASSLWANVVGVFHNALSGVSGAVLSIWNWINNFFGGLPAKMLQFGINMIQGLINGIMNMFGSIGSTMNHLVGFIGSFLPHSPAKQGELSHLNEYGPALVMGFARGITRSQGTLHSAMAGLVSPMGTLARGNAFSLSGSSGNAFALQGNGGNGSSGGPQTMNMTIQLDGKTITEAVGVRLAKELRIQGNVKNR